VTSASGRHRRTKIQTGVICISHEDKGRKKNPRWEEKMMRRRRNWIRVFTLDRGCFIYKHVLSGPRVKTRPVNIFYNRSQILHTADDNIKEQEREDCGRMI
jgi:hypothetical protein